MMVTMEEYLSKGKRKLLSDIEKKGKLKTKNLKPILYKQKPSVKLAADRTKAVQV